MILNAFKKITTAGVPSLQLVRRLDIITADGGGLYLNGSALAAAELTYIDGITAIGTAQASKAVVLDANKGIVGLGVTSVGTSNTSGVVLTSSATNALQVVAEDGGVAVTSGNIKAIKGRLYLKANAGDITADGILGQVKINTSITCSADYTNGVRGYLELVGGNTVNTGGANANTGCGGIGVHGWISVADNLTIASAHYLCGVASRLSVTATKSITTTGVLAAYGVFADDNLGGATATQTWGYGLYMPTGTVAQGILVGTSTSSPMVYAGTSTLNMVDINTKHTGVSGTVRGIVSYLEYSGTNAGVALNSYAIRGYTKMSGTSAANSFSAGVQGKLEMAGTVGGGKHCAVLAQLNSSAGLAGGTAGTIYCLWADGMQLGANPASALYVVGIGIEMPDAATRFDAALYVYGKATNLFDLSGNLSSYVVGATTKSTPGGVDNWLTIAIDGTTRYIPTYASTSA